MSSKDFTLQKFDFKMWQDYINITTFVTENDYTRQGDFGD